jgi:transposase-like protein
MPKAYSADMRARVIARVESGGSRREAAEHYGRVMAYMESRWRKRSRMPWLRRWIGQRS